MFVTVFYGILNMKSGELEYSNAGHNPPYLIKNNDSIQKLESTGDTVLGCFENRQFTSRKIQLNPNDDLILYTDGVTEAFNREGEEYGDERLGKLLASMQNLAASDIVTTIADDVNLFAQGVSQSDDITLFSLKYFG